MDLGMQGRTAVVTGAAGGIGSATALALAQQGVDVTLTDLPGVSLDAVAAEVEEQGVRCLTVPGDVRVLEDVEAVVSRCEAELGGPDFYVSVAGGGTPRSLATLTPDDWDAVVGLNLTGPFNGIKAAGQVMERNQRGAIVVVGSLAGLTMSMNNGMSYTAAKAGVLGLIRHAAFELAADGVRVNAVLPGPVLSAQIVKKMPEEIIERVANGLPRGSWVDPVEIANTILFYCSDLSAACIGSHVVVDSGLHIGAQSSRDEYFSRRDQ